MRAMVLNNDNGDRVIVIKVMVVKSSSNDDDCDR
jgi:uncharacterized Zn ribbon protein